MEFFKRDQRSVEYGKNSLDTGDTIVVIHPDGYKPLDPTGFALNKELRVHSKRLISTDSSKFEKIFSPEVQRAAIKLHYPDGLPDNIDYILDLRLVAPTNLDGVVGSEAVSEQLISELKCSKGVRSWFSSQGRCGIPSSVVGGRDAVTASSQTSPRTVKSNTKKLHSIRGPSNNKRYAEMFDSQVTHNDVKFHSDMLAALNISARGQGIPDPNPDISTLNEGNSELDIEDVLEYCPIRWRCAIENLLQIIEGKEPTWLDSAPKIWTLYVAAKYFECVLYVTDRIFAWLMTSNNVIFFEVLPEASLKMGFGLQNTMITRAAFAILASEEALRVASSADFPDMPRGVLDTEETRFLRVRESLDVAHIDLIQQAGEQLYNRVWTTWQELSDPQMKWLRALPEWEKIVRFKDNVSQLKNNELVRKTDQIIEDLESFLSLYVRGAIVRCLYESITSAQANLADNHRRLQQYTGMYNSNFKIIYDTFSIQERTMTRFFWQTLSKVDISEDNFSNWSTFKNESPFPQNPFTGRNDWISEKHGIELILKSDLQRKSQDFNDAAEDVMYDSDVTIRGEGEEKFDKFNVAALFGSVRSHIKNVCNKMLEKGDLEWAVSTDTVLCLTEQEYNCLPAWDNKEVVIEQPEEEEKEKCELTDLSDWEGADDGGMSDWDLLED